MEGPLSVDYLLKKICGIWGYENVTQYVKDSFKREFKSPIVIRENDFLYGKEQKNYAMREKIGMHLGDINYISDYELRNGMYAAVEINVQCKKEALFDFIRKNLGFDRAGEKMIKKFEQAYRLLLPYIIVDEYGIISINSNNKLKIVHRKYQKK